MTNMKYITTDTHPELKPGIVIDRFFNEKDVLIGFYFDTENEFTIELTCKCVNEWHEKGYIKELQEPKWTDDDLFELLRFYDNSNSVTKVNYRDIIRGFEKMKNA